MHTSRSASASSGFGDYRELVKKERGGAKDLPVRIERRATFQQICSRFEGIQDYERIAP